MFKKGDLVTVNAMGDSKNAVVLEDSKGSSTRVGIDYNNPLTGSANIKMSLSNSMIKLR